eukprot:3872805-Karenia_brevis.AAC.1
MLTEAEEKQRAHLTWQDFDYMLYLCSVCPETLKKYVVDVEEFRHSREHLVLEFEDEIPLW